MSGRVWFTSDLHLGNLHVASTRGFDADDSSVGRHDLAIKRNWNEVVRPSDTVWVLGDVCLDARNLPKVAELNGTKHLITGNHDAVFPGRHNSHKFYKIWSEYFASIQPFAVRHYDGTKFLLSHFPYSGDREAGTERCSQFRLKDEGLPLVHGHLHMPHVLHPAWPRQVHVGLDAWELRPVPLGEVVRLVREVSK
jgi:calcineurin-like phosphoesterase family protein